MMALDCESFELALASSASILEMPPNDLLEILEKTGYSALVDRIERNDLPTPPAVHWFHATGKLTAGRAHADPV